MTRLNFDPWNVENGGLSMSMKSAAVEIRLLSYWHIGSGYGRGAEVDALVLTDSNGLPYIPGRSLKGVFREASQNCEDVGLLERGRTWHLFGRPSEKGEYDGSTPGALFFRDACLKEEDRACLVPESKRAFRNALFDTLASTSVNQDGVGEDHTLRTIQVCVPVTLYSEITSEEESFSHDLEKAAILIRGIGSRRNRGLGRCEVVILKGGHRDA